MKFSILFTNKCNLSCKYCYEQFKNKNVMSSDTIDKIIDFILLQKMKNNESKLSILTHGGEPILAFDEISYFISRLNGQAKNVMYNITTNATLLNDETINFIANHYNEIRVSVDGIENAHNMHRIYANGKGSHKDVILNCEKLLKLRDDIIARMTVTPETVGYLFESVRYLINMGFKRIIPVPDQSSLWNKEGIDELYKQGISIIDYLHDFNKEDFEIGLIQDALVKRKNSICNGGINSFAIDIDGTIYPCLGAIGVKEFKLGHIDGQINQTLLGKISMLGQIENETCTGCTRYDFCVATRCKILNKISYGDFHVPSPVACNVENVRVKLANQYLAVTQNN